VPSSSSARWRRVDELFHAALAQPPGRRHEFLASHCGGDRALSEEVLSLIQADAAGTDTDYEAWAPRVAVAWNAETRPSLSGETIGRYCVLERLGVGAMGEVYRAEDTALRRHVALKTLLPFAGDAARMDRLEDEARTASALNHPNILTIHEISHVAGVPFIASELVDGDTLRDRLAGGPLPLDTAIDVATQVAAGLGAAHAAGVIHRDIKPENLMVRRDGLVKIVDFGLAEPIAPIRTDEGRTPAGRAAVAEGTLSYMSPEQAGSEPLDARTDLFSLGVVIYEMVTGSVPFERPGRAATVDALLHDPAPRPSTVNTALPAALDALIARALERDRERRYQTASELEADLKSVRLRYGRAGIANEHAPAEGSGNNARQARSPVRGRIALAALGMAAVAGGVLWLSAMRRSARDGLDPADLTFLRVTKQAGEELFPSLAPGGDAIVYASAARGNWDIYLHRVGGSPVNLTEGSAFDDIQPVYSPDGQTILFRSDREGGGLFVMPASGGPVTRVSDIGWDPAWSPDGEHIVCSTARVEPTTVRLPQSQLWVVDARTGEKRQLLDGPAYQPQWSPSGTRIAFFGPDAAGQRDLWTVAVAGGAPVRVTTGRYSDWNPVWSADGRFLYFLSDRAGTMNAWRVRIDETTGRPLDAPGPFTLPATNVMYLARAAGSEALTWSNRSGGGTIRRYDLDPARAMVRGKPVSLTSPSRSLLEPEVSPDGTLLVANTRGDSRDDIVVLRADGTQVRALTEDEPRDRDPRWSPDGRRVAFWSDRSGGTSLFLIDSDGSRLQQVVGAGDPDACCPVWSPDGRYLAYLARDLVIHAVDLSGGLDTSRDRILATLPAGVWFQPVSWSADGSRIAGQERRDNNPRGGVAIYNLSTRQYTRLTASGGQPVWLNDSRRLLYTDGSSAYAVDSLTGHAHALFSVLPYHSSDLTVTRDNRHLYVSVRENDADVWVATPPPTR